MTQGCLKHGGKQDLKDPKLVLLRRQLRVDAPILGVEEGPGLQVDFGNDHTHSIKVNETGWAGE